MKTSLHRFAQRALLTATFAAGCATQLLAAPGDVVFSETFDTEESLANWKIVDNNGATTWRWLNGTAAYLLDYQTGLPGDDWLISPEFQLDDSNVYTLEFTMKVMTRPESLRVLIGNGDEPSAFTTVLADYNNVESDASGLKTVKVNIKTSGKFRLAFYAYSEPNGHRVEVDDIKLTETSAKGVPAHVETLTLTPGDKGAMTASLNFTAPTVTAGDAALAANMGIDIYRNDETTAAKQFEDVAPGAALAWTDDAPAHGHNIYKVVTRNASGTGESASATAFVGLDAPKPVTDLAARLNAQRGTTLSWTAPTESANGGYVDFGNVKYIVKRDGTQLGDPVAATSFTDANPVDEGQKAVSYTVTPMADGQQGNETKSGEVVTGTPLAAPYHESFARQKMATPWTLDPDIHDFGFELLPDDEDGEYEEIVSQDKDNGVLCFDSKTADYDSQSRLVSPLLDLSSLTSPVLSFWFYYARSPWYDPDYDGEINDNLQVQYSTDAGEWHDIEGAKFFINESSLGWVKCEAHIPAQAKGSFTRIGLLATAQADVSAYRNMYVDNFSVDEPENNVDLALESVTPSKKRLNVGETLTLTATVFNRGREAVSDYSVLVQLNNKTYTTIAGKTIKPSERIKYDITFTPTIDNLAKDQTWRVGTVCDADEYKYNDIADVVTTSTRPNDVPAVTGLNGSRQASGNVITWTAANDIPAVGHGDPVSVTDDFESYTPFLTSGFGDWTVYDGDRASTLATSRIPLRYEHEGEAMAFQVFNTTQSGTWVDDNLDDAFHAHSGEQYLICPSANYPVENDDWLISPRLDGRAQTVTFWTKSATYDAEWIQLLASSTDNHHDSFVKVSEGDHLPIYDFWRQYTFDVPEGTRYFAIRCTRRSVMLFVDDITYNRYDGATDGATLLGYNVYRDGQKLNDMPVAGNTFTDAVTDSKTHKYRVTAVYDLGESAYSDELAVSSTTAIDGIAADSANAPAATFNAAGQRTSSATRGLHIVRTADGKVRKVMNR